MEQCEGSIASIHSSFHSCTDCICVSVVLLPGLLYCVATSDKLEKEKSVRMARRRKRKERKRGAIESSRQ